MRITTKRAVIALAIPAAAVVGITTIVGAGHENIVLQTELEGRNEVGDDAMSRANVGDRNGRGEAYVFGIDGDPTTLCYVLTVDDIGEAAAAHIHEGADGANGPVVVNLAAPGDGNSADCLTEGEMVGPNQDVPAFDGTTVAEVLGAPEDYYVNVHTELYPDGAIRGQLVANEG